jgi:hypothetical protein
LVALTVRVCEPTARPLAVHGLEHPLAGAPSRLHTIVDDESETLKATVALVRYVGFDGPDVMVTAGALFFTCQEIEPDPEPEPLLASTTRL